MPVIDQIKEKYPFLTRKQREVADYMLEDTDRMSYVTLKEMSKDTGITEMTILKTCSLLGFSSFSGMKYEFRKHASKQVDMIRRPYMEYTTPRTPDYELSDTDRLLSEICSEEAALNARFFGDLDVRRIFDAADLLLEADKVVICGRGVSYYVCEYLAALMTVLGRGVIVVNTEMYDQIHSSLPLITENTVLVAVSYPDYYHMTSKMVEFVARRGGRVLLMTDTEKCPAYAMATQVICAPTQTRMFLNSLGTPMMMVNFLSSAMNIRLSNAQESYTEPQDTFYSLFDDEDEE